MQHHEIDAPASLQDVIVCFWHLDMDAGEMHPGFEVLPDGYAEIIFYVGSTCSIATAAGWQPLLSPFLVGLLGQPMTLRAADKVEVIGVKCHPWAVFELLGLPADKKGVRVFDHPVAQLQPVVATLLQAGKVDAVFAALEQYFVQTRLRTATDNMLVKAGEAMRKANGTLPVSQVAAAANATTRTLERNFKHAAGHTVKDVSGLMRFEQVRDHLWCHPDTNLAGLAQELGYADQAHLSREFKRYTGITPTAFARKAKQQALDNGFVAFVSAR